MTTGRLHQINLAYDAGEDRLLLRVSTAAGLEYRAWLTRALVRQWWGGLTTTLQQETARTQPATAASAPAQAALHAFRHEAALQNARFGEPYPADGLRPAQASPLLVHTVRARLTDGAEQEFQLLPRRGEGLVLRLNSEMLHAFARLLRDAVDRTGWNLELPGPFAAQAPAAPAAARLN